jgi:hypothetical protein
MLHNAHCLCYFGNYHFTDHLCYTMLIVNVTLVTIILRITYVTLPEIVLTLTLVDVIFINCGLDHCHLSHHRKSSVNKRTNDKENCQKSPQHLLFRNDKLGWSPQVWYDKLETRVIILNYKPSSQKMYRQMKVSWPKFKIPD